MIMSASVASGWGITFVKVLGQENIPHLVETELERWVLRISVHFLQSICLLLAPSSPIPECSVRMVPPSGISHDHSFKV